jgi:enamine deaminase RidA (YjgF/YER057c/UK114 family)
MRRSATQAVQIGDTIDVAGTLGIGEGFAIPEDMGEQTTLAYANIAEALAHFGADTSHVVEQSGPCDGHGRGDRSAGGSQAGVSRGGLPVSTMVEVTRLAVPEAKVEISVIARVDA